MPQSDQPGSETLLIQEAIAGDKESFGRLDLVQFDQPVFDGQNGRLGSRGHVQFLEKALGVVADGSLRKE